MESPVTFHQCSYLEPHFPTCDITSGAAELVHINEEIRSLDNHICQLTELRYDLHRRSVQLQNLRSPIYTLPTEILSDIFLQVADLGTDPFYIHTSWVEKHKIGLYQPVVLSSVTAHFRRVAFGTADLWKMVPLVLTRGTTDKAAALLLHCLSHAPHVNVFIEDLLPGDAVPSTIDTLFYPGVTPKIKSFDLRYSINAAELWIEKLRLASFPILDSLNLRLQLSREDRESLNFDFGTLTSLIRLGVYSPHLSLPVVIPPSVQVLHHVPFAESLTLTRLKRFTWTPEVGLDTISSVQNLHMPSIEYLKLKLIFNNFDAVHLLCRRVSPTLTTLVLETPPYALDPEKLRQLFRGSFPRLETLTLQFYFEDSMLNVFHALTPRDNESNDSEALPSLRKLTLSSGRGRKVPRRQFLDLLKRWRVGETSYFHVEVNAWNGMLEDPDWSLDLLEELKSIVGNRQIEVTWGTHTILQPGCRNSA